MRCKRAGEHGLISLRMAKILSSLVNFSGRLTVTNWLEILRICMLKYLTPSVRLCREGDCQIWSSKDNIENNKTHKSVISDLSELYFEFR